MNTEQLIRWTTGNGSLAIDERRIIGGAVITRETTGYHIVWPDETAQRLRYRAKQDNAHEDALLRLRLLLLERLCDDSQAVA
jgi:hypothetical protein